ncbi:PLAC8 motif-containing protein [Trema orientale]|uniref:PLAC8 motif-containing protein n=1 Tax=Trema orientale TaxID=63057 RepID=A0A2P5FAJ0_TREOI|nr:PLAC8 motif-containing protein [Trema orientale]
MNIFRNIPIRPRWSYGLCECGKDFCTCCLTCLLPCVTFGRIAEIVDEGKHSCCCMGCGYCCLALFQFQWLLACFYREKLRSKYGLPDEPCCDCCVHFFCEPCALCQEHAELKSRGLDPAKGYAKSQIFPPRFPSMFR